MEKKMPFHLILPVPLSGGQTMRGYSILQCGSRLRKAVTSSPELKCLYKTPSLVPFSSELLWFSVPCRKRQSWKFGFSERNSLTRPLFTVSTISVTSWGKLNCFHLAYTWILKAANFRFLVSVPSIEGTVERIIFAQLECKFLQQRSVMVPHLKIRKPHLSHSFKLKY